MPRTLSVGPPDAELIAGVLRKDEAAFRALYRRHTPHLLPVVLRLLNGTEADADDVLQETWIAAAKARSAAPPGSRRFERGLRGSRSIAAPRSPASAGTLDIVRFCGTSTPTPVVPVGMRIDLERAIALTHPATAPCSCCTTSRATPTKKSARCSRSRLEHQKRNCTTPGETCVRCWSQRQGDEPRCPGRLTMT